MAKSETNTTMEDSPRTASDPDSDSVLPKVFVIGFPKTGTTSLQEALTTGGWNAAHWVVPGTTMWEEEVIRTTGELSDKLVGKLMWKAHKEGLDPLAYFAKDVNAFTQLDATYWETAGGSVAPTCFGFFPQMSMLDELMSAYPHALFILNSRSPQKWVKSVSKHNDMRDRMVASDLPNLPRGVGTADEDLLKWFDWHHTRARDAAARHQVKFLEFNIDVHGETELCDFLGRKVSWGAINVTDSATWSGMVGLSKQEWDSWQQHQPSAAHQP